MAIMFYFTIYLDTLYKDMEFLAASSLGVQDVRTEKHCFVISLSKFTQTPGQRFALKQSICPFHKRITMNNLLSLNEQKH